MISLEQAIHNLTFHVASVYGIEGRNGKVVYEDGKINGEMAGKVLRGTAYQAGQ